MPTATVPAFTTSTNLGPLPTTSFPPNCLSNLYDFQTIGLGIPYTYETVGCALSTCCPSGHFYTDPFAWMTSYYSPGTCPQDYQTCALPDYYTSMSSVSGQEINLCCPSSYKCPTGGNSLAICQSLLGTSTVVTVLDNIFDQSIISTRAFTIPASLQSQDYSSNQIAYPIQIRNGGSATGGSVTTPVATSNFPGGTGTTSAGNGQVTSGSSTASQSAATAGSDSKGGLSTGSIAGIATGVVSSVVGILGLAFRVYKWKHPKKQPVVNGVSNDPQKIGIQ